MWEFNLVGCVSGCFGISLLAFAIVFTLFVSESRSNKSKE